MCILILLSELFLLFKGQLIGIFGVGIGSLLHLFVLRAIILASTSLVSGISMWSVSYDSGLLPFVNLGAFAAQIITLLLFINLVPLKTLGNVMNDREFYTALLGLTILLNVYMLFNTYIFAVDYFSVTLAVQEIVIAVFILAFFYIMMLLLIKIFNLGIYKNKAKKLEDQIDSDKSLTSAVLSFAEIIIGINCTQNTITRMLINSDEVPVDHLPSFSEFFQTQSNQLTHPADLAAMTRITPASIMLDFENGVVDRMVEYRAKRILPSAQGTGINTNGDDYYWYRMRINSSLNPDTGDIVALLTMDDVDNEKREELKLRKKAETDPLTGSYNRDTLALKVDEYLKDGGSGTFYMFDLDNFKGINDNMGHLAGDAVLREVYAKITSIFRPHDIISRVGGDEFVVFLLGTTKQSTVTSKAVSICAQLRKVYHADNGVDITVSSSIGIALAPKDGTDFETLFNAADLAMYHSKSIGKNTFTIYNSSSEVGYKPQEKEDYMRLRSTSD